MRYCVAKEEFWMVCCCCGRDLSRNTQTHVVEVSNFQAIQLPLQPQFGFASGRRNCFSCHCPYVFRSKGNYRDQMTLVTPQYANFEQTGAFAASSLPPRAAPESMNMTVALTRKCTPA